MSITLGESVTHIGDGAFSRCTSLASITLGESVTHIGEGAFHGCTSLASITIPETLRHILKSTLGSLSVAVITIPARQGRKRLSECTDLLWCQCLNDWYDLRKNRRAYGLVMSDELR